MSTHTSKDRGGRTPDMCKAAGKMVRESGLRWLSTMRRQADAGDPAAIRLLLDMAEERKAKTSKSSPETTQ